MAQHAPDQPSDGHVIVHAVGRTAEKSFRNQSLLEIKKPSVAPLDVVVVSEIFERDEVINSLMHLLLIKCAKYILAKF